MKSLIAIIPVVACALVLTSCPPPQAPQAPPEEKPKPEVPTPRRLIGRISSAQAGQNFILVQSFTNISLSPGTILTTRGADGRAANIKITGEALGNMVAADLQSGEVEIGDSVYVPNLDSTESSGESTESP